MARRALVATMVTTVVGSVVGAGLGALVGRLIALFGDPTIETSVPMVFCGALGFFVGGASAAKGSLERFGARKASLGTAVAAAILIVLVGGAFFARSAGAVVFGVGVVAAALAGLAAAAVSAPQDAPVPYRGAKPSAAPATSGKSRAGEPSEATAPPEPAAPSTRAESIRKVAVPRQPENIDEPPPEPKPARRNTDVNWSLDDTAAPTPPAKRPRRDRPLRKDDA